MANDWIDPDLPGVSHVKSSRRVKLTGSGERIATAHSFESKGYNLTAEAGARYLISQASEAHFVANLYRGELVQLLPASTGARTLRAGQCVTNAFGSRHIQVEFIGDAARPFTGDISPAGRRVLGYLLDFTKSHGIPEQWAGKVRPPKYPGPGVKRFMPKKGVNGWTHHAAWKCNDHGDPGAIADLWKLDDGGSNPPTPPPSGVDALGRYTVREGDRLGAIAARFRTSIGALVLLNGIANPNRIDVGDRLFTRWVVGRGDTLGAISKATGASVSQLVRLNNLSDPDYLAIGQLIRLP